ncbi:F-box domain-containing protein [Fusarium sp. LHS14.1]|nr:F-box domain-containing protein [Fusarium sp. LHS14.1]
MHQQSKLESLPCELLDGITSYLQPHQLAQLSYTCKYLSQHVESLLWESVELHKPGYHASSVEPNSAPPIRPASYYRWIYGWTSFLRASHRAEAFFTMLQRLHRDDPEHLQRLAGRVKSICAVIKPDWQLRTADGHEAFRGEIIQFWQLVPFFTNLEKLELHGDLVSESEHEQLTPEITTPPLPLLLQVAKLFGYIPCTVAASTILSYEENLLRSRDISEGDSQNECEACEIDHNDEYFHSTIPRPLVNFLPSSPNLEFRSELTLPRLKHLHLCQPCKGSCDTYVVNWSISAQAKCLSDWRGIILACGDTVEVLVLEQRPSIDLWSVEGRHLDEAEVLVDDRGGRRHRALIKMVQRLLAFGNALKGVKRVYLYGMVVGQDELWNPAGGLPSGRFMHLLKMRGVKCEARQGHWFVYDEDFFECPELRDDSYGDEEMEDSGELDFMCRQTLFLAKV